jgi:uncharacterized membrane protein (UPF0127 family)
MRAFFLSGMCALLAGCGGSGPQTATISDIYSTDVTFPNGTRILAENMRKELDVMRGMMFRDSLPEGHGLLITHGSENTFAYFMYQTRIPLDIVWMNKRQQIVEIVENVPPCPSKSARECPSYGGHQKAIFVLEVNAGVAGKNGLRVGDRLEF